MQMILGDQDADGEELLTVEHRMNSQNVARLGQHVTRAPMPGGGIIGATESWLRRE